MENRISPGTLARQQRFVTLGAVGLVLTAGLLGWTFGRVASAAAFTLAILGSPAVVLGLEFLLLGSTHGDDPTPRATPRQLLRAWWAEVLATPTVFCWRQPFRSQLWPDYLPERCGNRGLLLVHGFVCNRGIWNHWMQRLRGHGTPFVAVNLEPVFASVDHYAEIIETAVRRLQSCTGQPPVIVAHSMGGLAVRRWWSRFGGDDRVHRVITIATPHRGTWLARFAFSQNGREMRMASDWLAALEHTEPPARAAKFICFYGHCDNIVFPPIQATLQGADNRHLPGVAHVHMVDHAAPLDEALHQLSSGARR